MKKCKIVITFIIIFSILLSIPTPVNAIIPGSDTAPSTTNRSAYFIPIEVAEEIAMLFVSDTINLEDVTWDSETEVYDITIMYNIDGDVNAYTFELSDGYVVVSAYGDVPNIILEWSDRAEPIYKELELTNTDQIVYCGSLNYYKDSGSEMLQALNGATVSRHEISDDLASISSVSYVPIAIKNKVNNAHSTTQDVEGSDDYIDNAIEHANEWYEGPFVCDGDNWENDWDNGVPITLYETSDFKDLDDGYTQHCGPTAITNFLSMYGNRYNILSIKNTDPDDIFRTVAQIGYDYLYYYNWEHGGTANASAGNYVVRCFQAFGINNVVKNYRKGLMYNNIRSTLENNHIAYVMLTGHPKYGNHHVICYAYTRLVSRATGYYKTYLKVADGHSHDPRFLDLAAVTTDTYWEIDY